MSSELRVLSNFINGEFTAALDGGTSEVFNPSTGQAYASAALSGAPDLDRAYASAALSGAPDLDRAYADAATAFESWGRTTPAGRQRALLKVAVALESRADEFVAAESENTGKPLALTASEELPPAVDQLRFFAGAARMLEGRSAGEYLAGHTSFVRREPIGVVGQVTPWNYPLTMAIWKIGPALAAGNTIVVKPSDTTPVTTLLLAELAAEFLPPGVLNVVTGDRNTGSALVSHPAPAMVAITGSIRAGIQVAQAAAPDVKRVHLELGGKAPVIVFDDADVEAAAAAIAIAGYFNGGQDCTAATRVMVSPGIHERLRRGIDRAGPKHGHRAALERERSLRAGQQRQSAGPCRGFHRSASRPCRAECRRLEVDRRRLFQRVFLRTDRSVGS